MVEITQDGQGAGKSRIWRSYLPASASLACGLQARRPIVVRSASVTYHRHEYSTQHHPTFTDGFKSLRRSELTRFEEEA